MHRHPATNEPRGESLLWALSAGYAQFPEAPAVEHAVAFFVGALDVLADFDVPMDTRLPRERACAAVEVQNDGQDSEAHAR